MMGRGGKVQIDGATSKRGDYNISLDQGDPILFGDRLIVSHWMEAFASS
jgi:hypothetical protein